jgi:hypothetical protein
MRDVSATSAVGSLRRLADAMLSNTHSDQPRCYPRPLAHTPVSCYTLEIGHRTAIYQPLGSVPMAENSPSRSYFFLGHVETAVYAVLGILLAATALLAIIGSLHLLANGIRDFTGTAAIFLLIDRLLLVLMLVELLHTVRISIRSHALVVEPFLIIGLIAIIRRTLVLTLQAEGFTQDTQWTSDVESHFRASMVEAGVLALLIAVLVASIYVIRKTRSEAEINIAGDSSPH